MEEEREEEGPVRTTYNVLFVCTGNTCRSPMAEAIARREVDRRGWKHVTIASAGTAAYEGSPASDAAVRAIRSAGLDLSQHRARSLSPDLVEWADVILAMSPSHLAIADALGGGYKSALLTDFASGEETGRGVLDPFGGDVETYLATLNELEHLVPHALDRMTSIVRP